MPPVSPDTFQGNRLRDLLDRRQTTADLIEQEGCDIALQRPAARVSDGAGGWVSPGGPATPQNAVRRFFSLVQYEPQDQQNTIVGERELVKFVLVGKFNDDIQEGDFFEFGDRKYTVDFINPDRYFEVRAEGAYVSDGS